jgi:hypothetical protein
MPWGVSALLDRARPTPQGGRAPIGNKVTFQARAAYLENLRAIAPLRTEAELRRRLVAIGERRLEQVAYTPRAELWLKIVDGWKGCGWTVLFTNPASGTVVGLPSHCDRLLCPYCEARRLAALRDRYRPAALEAAKERRLFFAVLTMPNCSLGELRRAMSTLVEACCRLRRRRGWTDAIAGGIWRYEVTFNLREQTWHPHLNLLVESKGPLRMAHWQPILQREWRSVLARLGVTWRGAGGELSGQWGWLEEAGRAGLSEAIKQQLQQGASSADVDDAIEQAVNRGIDYTVKPDPDWSDPSHPEWVVEYVEAAAGRRSLNSFGTWRGLPKPKSEPAEELVSAPYVPGEFFTERRLPYLDPLTDQPAAWEFATFGPRHLLRPFRPAGENRQEWLIWHPSLGDPGDPTVDLDELAITYQPPLAMPP